MPRRRELRPHAEPAHARHDSVLRDRATHRLGDQHVAHISDYTEETDDRCQYQ
jgi:hypothetical protein